MAIVGHGIDLVDVRRIARMLEEHGERFLERVFTGGERAYAQGRKRSAEHLAGRFAVKEAVLKALGTGWRSGIAWTDIEVTVLPSGQPSLRLSGKAAQAATELGAATWWVSISHTGSAAIGSAIAES